ncbi:hypothetical protein [Psychromonas aquimarina]|uniref:hypothetical protein n=1 Tax=Psychromonas aquimarina TaxID=444919 RepID=UPI0004088534|nr:hypothetical protein [Psychromonas aquimarina]
MMSKAKIEVLNNIKHLWHVEDEAWLKGRKEQWRYIKKMHYKEAGASEIKKMQQYFLYGEKEKYLGTIAQFLYTPYDSPESMKELFYSKLYGVAERKEILSGFIGTGSLYGLNMPWLPELMAWFVDTFLGSEYQLTEEMHGKTPETISPEPTSWCGSFCRGAIKFLNNQELQYNGYTQCIDYSISCLQYATNTNLRSRIKFEELLTRVKEFDPEVDSRPLAKDFVDSILAREDEMRANWQLSADLISKMEA